MLETSLKSFKKSKQKEVNMPEKQRIVCPNCKGLSVIETSVDGNPWRGRTYECDVCQGTGYVGVLFNEIFNAIRGRCISDDSASVAAAEVTELIVEKYTTHII